MKLSIALIAAVSASPSGRSGKPSSMSPGHHHGKPSMKPHSGHAKSPKPHHDDNMKSPHFEHEMEEEWREFAEMMHGGADNNIMNVNFAPVNQNQQNWVNINTEVETDVNVNSGYGKKDGKDGKDGKGKDEMNYDEDYGMDHMDFKKHMMKMIKMKVTYAMKMMIECLEPYEDAIKAVMEKLTGMDCEELLAMIEEEFFDGHKVAEIVHAIRKGDITMEDIQMWAMEKWEECEWNKMSEEEKYEQMKEFLMKLGIDCEEVKAGLEEMIGMKFDEIKQLFKDNIDMSGDTGDIDVDDIAPIVDDIFPM